MSLFPRLFSYIRSVFDRFFSTLRRSPLSASGFHADGMPYWARVLDFHEHLNIAGHKPLNKGAGSVLVPFLVAIVSGAGMMWFFMLILHEPAFCNP